MKKTVIALICLCAAASCGKTIQPAVQTELSVETAEITVPADATSAAFNILSNASWQVECTSAVPTLDEEEWLTGYTKYGINNAPVEVEFTANTARNVTRTATFSVTAMDKSITLTLTQRPVDFVAELTVSEPEISVDYNVKEAEFEVKANVPWSVSTDSDWVRSYTKSGNEDGTITVEVHFERPTDTGFDSARCSLPSYTWLYHEGFSAEEIERFEQFLKRNVHLFFKFAGQGGIFCA